MQERAKQFFKTYGKLGMGVYLAVSAVNYGLVYFAIKEGVDVKKIGAQLGMDTTQGKWQQIETFGTPTAAYIVYKFMAPIKWPIVIGTTAFICRRGKK